MQNEAPPLKRGYLLATAFAEALIKKTYSFGY